MSSGYRTLHLDDIATVRFDGEADIPSWKPVRRELGISAFGTNAYVGDTGDVVVEPHDELDETGEGDRGHQEIYLVLDGSARFTVDGDDFDVAKGGIVFLEDPALPREAVALEPGTIVFAVGAAPGEVFVPSAWEDEFLRRGTRDAG